MYIISCRPSTSAARIWTVSESHLPLEATASKRTLCRLSTNTFQYNMTQYTYTIT